nr:MAG TPA: hypothetical protein [Caudoviricetes sp.]
MSRLSLQYRLPNKCPNRQRIDSSLLDVTRLTYSKATDNLKLADGGAIPKLKTAVCPWNNPS